MLNLLVLILLFQELLCYRYKLYGISTRAATTGRSLYDHFGSASELIAAYLVPDRRLRIVLLVNIDSPK